MYPGQIAPTLHTDWISLTKPHRCNDFREKLQRAAVAYEIVVTRHPIHPKAGETHLFSNLKYDLRSANTSALSAAEYAQCYDTWGGSFIVHPDVLTYFQDAHDIKVRYRGYFE